MKRTLKLDPFFSDQPELTFLEDLTKPFHSEKPYGFTHRVPEPGEADVKGMYIAERFPDDKDLLETSVKDFELFLRLCEADGENYPLRLVKGETPVFEAWKLTVTPEGATITANDTEGIRRALVYIESEMQRLEGPFLPLGTVEKQPHMRLRITRCFFSPINRPPKYGDELSDDIDYYPEEYLNKLMHDGANAVWIYTRFSDLVYSSYLSDYGKGSEARIAKLNRVCEKCARYGIRPYIFAIEPVALTEEQLAEIGEEVDGGEWYGKHLFCANSEKGRAFVGELGERLFTLCPGLGGFISITYGERPSSCSTAYGRIHDVELARDVICPRCKELTPGQTLAKAVEALCAGIHRANPNADVISWTYGHRRWDFEDVKDYVREAPQDAILMQNMEDVGYMEQLGKPRLAMDYWLSYAGPSDLFRVTAEEAQRCGKTMFMKTQATVSHEVATVPYIPVPGLIYDRYHSAHDLGVTGAMQCWYFGNYPSMMSRAAGELAFISDFSDKRGFLEWLAGIYWGRSCAPMIADAWQEFEAGYRCYPLNIMFSYYGPMHDGPVWELALKVKDFSLPRSWQTLDPTDGDRIGECLMGGHTLDEAITLCTEMSAHWDRGLALMRKAGCAGLAAKEQLSVAETLSVLFSSGVDVLKFYRLRDRLGRREGNPQLILSEMRELVEKEMGLSEKLIGLCEADGRLGYHSEGEGYKYFPKKLRHRIEQLRRLLATEFPEVEARVAAGLAPLTFYTGEEPDYKHYAMSASGIETAAWEPIGEKAAFRAAYDTDKLIIEWKADTPSYVYIVPEFELLRTGAYVKIKADGTVWLDEADFFHCSYFGDKVTAVKKMWKTEVLPCEGGMHLRATLSRSEIGWTRDDLPLRMRFEIDGALWCDEEEPVHTLGKHIVSPGEFGFLMPKGL